MGLLNFDDAIDDQFEQTEVGAKRLPAGTYQGSVSNIQLVTGDDVWKPWVNIALQVQLTTDEGKASTQIELDPLTGKDGTTSPGKLKFLKWQLRSLGYEGSLKNLEAAIMNGIFHGNVVNFEVKETQSTQINEKTGQPFVNRDVVVTEFVEGGLGNSAAVDELAAQLDAVEIY